MSGIKKCRLAARLTQAGLAKRIGVTQSTIAMWETGKAQPRASMLVELGKVLGVTVDALLCGLEEESRVLAEEDLPPWDVD